MELKNFVLLIIILVLVVAILLKVPGLSDKVFGSLENKFGGAGATEGKYLYLRLAPSGNQLLEFFVTDEPKQNLVWEGGVMYFMPDIKTLPSDKCVIYSVLEKKWGLMPTDYTDYGLFYYVNSGTIIQDGTCGSLGECINEVSTKNCVEVSTTGCSSVQTLSPTECYNKAKGDYHLADCKCAKFTLGWKSACGMDGCCQSNDMSKDMENFEFKDNPDLGSSCDLTNGGNPVTPSKCNIVVPGQYKIKYGLICDVGTWEACTDAKDGQPPKSGTMKNCLCQQVGSVWEWTGDCTVTATSTPSKSLTLSANPTHVLPDGASTSTITVQTSSGVVISFSSNRGTTDTLSSSSCTTDTTGKCSVTIKSSSGGTAIITASNSEYGSSDATVTFTSITTVPTNPTPADGATSVSLTPKLSWNAVSGAQCYSVNIIKLDTWLTSDNFYTVPAGKLSVGNTYQWEVAAWSGPCSGDIGQTGGYNTPWSFTT